MTGGTGSSIVTLDPMSWVWTESPAPRLHTAVRPAQQPAEIAIDVAVPWTTELCGESAFDIVMVLSIGPAAPQ